MDAVVLVGGLVRVVALGVGRVAERLRGRG
jgi:hypothetical protein